VISIDKDRLIQFLSLVFWQGAQKILPVGVLEDLGLGLDVYFDMASD